MRPTGAACKTALRAPRPLIFPTGRTIIVGPWTRGSAVERLAQGAAQAELARSYGVSQSTIAGWLHPALSRQARSAREEAEVKETWQIVNGIAADQVNHRVQR